MSADTLNLPIIDLSEFDNENTRAHFFKKLRAHARDYGFFYLIGHGIDPNEREVLLDTAKEFFALPQEVKDTISMDNSPHFRGYTKVGRENTRNKTDFREQLDIGNELVPEVVYKEDDPLFYRNLHGPNQWTKEVPELKERSLEWIKKCRALAIKLLRAFMGALGLPEDSFDAVLSGVPRDFLKLAHYPGNTDGAPERQGVGPHKDSDILTLLWQDETGGLQVFLEGKGWIDAVPLKNSFIVNVGETLELATDGYLTADIHQVVMDARHTKSRYSIPYFIGPNLDLKEIPILSLPKELKDQARGPATDPMNPLIRNPGINTMKGRLRSHLGTTERFYPEHYKIIKEKGIIASSAY